MLKLTTFILVLFVIAGCGGGDNNDTANNAAPTTAAKPSDAAPANDKGVGPIADFDVSTLDPARATAGKEVFTAKCTPCHKIEERYIGPALLGVTKRRRPEWILNMILNPEGMVKFDERAKSLLAEYIAPMTNQNLTEEEAKSVLAYFLENDKGL